MELQELTLRITPRAQERLLAMGKEFYIAVMKINSPRGPLPLAVCRPGAPKNPDEFTRLTGGELTVWAPNSESFIKNEVAIDLFGFGGMVLPAALTAILIPTCEDGCAGCPGACASRTEEDC